MVDLAPDRYEAVASLLVAMRRLHEAAGTGAAFDAEIREMRATYKRRTLLMKELNRSRLAR